jgi:hypothetical protein
MIWSSDQGKEKVLGTKFIEELLSLVDQGERDDTARHVPD